MESLKKILGSSFHEGITLEEVDKALADKKIVSNEEYAILEKKQSGGYVDVDKFNKLQEKLNGVDKEYKDYRESVKDFDSIKSERDTLKSEKETSQLRETIRKSGCKEEFIDYLVFQTTAGKIQKDEQFEQNVKSFLKENKQYSNQSPKLVINTGAGGDGKGKGGSAEDEKERNASINSKLREAAGIKVDIGNE